MQMLKVAATRKLLVLETLHHLVESLILLKEQELEMLNPLAEAML